MEEYYILSNIYDKFNNIVLNDNLNVIQEENKLYYFTNKNNLHLLLKYVYGKPIYVRKVKANDNLTSTNGQIHSAPSIYLSKKEYLWNTNLHKSIIEYDNTFICSIRHFTDDVCNFIVDLNGMLLCHIPPNCITLEIYLKALNNNYYSIEYLDVNNNVTFEDCLMLCEKYVQVDGLLLEFINEKFKTLKICQLALDQNIYAFEYIHLSDEITNDVYYEICKNVLKQDGMLLKYINTSFLTNELCEISIKQNGDAIDYVPRNMKTYNICKQSVTYNCENLLKIPYEFKNCEIYVEALKQDGLLLSNINDDYTMDMCNVAIEQNPHALKFILNKLTEKSNDQDDINKLCLTSINKDPSCLKYIEDPTKEMYEAAVKNDYTMFAEMLPQYQSEQFCMEILEKHLDAFRYIDKKKQTYIMCKYVLDKDPSCYTYVNQELKYLFNSYKYLF